MTSRYEKTERLPHGKHPKDMTGDELWEAYGKWVVALAKAFYKLRVPLMPEGPEELYGVGYLSLVEAARAWDTEKGASFCTYSKRRIIWEFHDYVGCLRVGKVYQEGGKKILPLVLSSDTMCARKNRNGYWEDTDKTPDDLASAEAELLQNLSLEYSTNQEKLLDLIRMVRQVIRVSGRISNVVVRQYLVECLMDEKPPGSLQYKPVGPGYTRANINLNLQYIRMWLGDLQAA